ncbi:TIGR04282 family arsenosugar biosynthesis glycosyltransferase [Qipengyuania aurantiaca]|uniref:TIGR04282 family arsenosugar biosynthesis glycosyltransferase n=1 Tax=Qipengyuania aurantiaca TaxID=2867233 RepID=A0ABX8ZIP2_9SPHN|nr:TIGR04282 family arsenosugar biosynthesis glycosyltransferase [Qipengyuania aurantiaca]QZD88817.1 TIGR04282 family arsenosugar biosynthesis glycosyltransferase [Qipengyuania aurantiaca]
MAEPQLSIFARLPVPGKVKTRLIPALGEEGAARVYARLLAQTVEVARASGLAFELRVTGGEEAAFRQLFGEDIAVAEQGEGDLGARMARVPSPALIIGSDCPGITPALLQAAAEALDDRRVVIGPATDGGYYLIGYREPVPFVFADMEWSTPRVFTETLARLAAEGYGPAILPELADIDTGEDLASWPEFQ